MALGNLLNDASIEDLRLMRQLVFEGSQTTRPTRPKPRGVPGGGTQGPWIGEAREAISGGATGAVAKAVADLSPAEVQAVNCGLRVADEEPVIVWRVVNPDDPDVPYVFMPCPTTCYGMEGLFGVPVTGIATDANDEALKFTDSGCSTEEITDCPDAITSVPHSYGTLAGLLGNDPTLLTSGTLGYVTNEQVGSLLLEGGDVLLLEGGDELVEEGMATNNGTWIITGSDPGEVDAANVWTKT